MTRPAPSLVLFLSLWFPGLMAAKSSAAPSTSVSGDDVIARIALVGDPHVSRELRYAQYVANFDRVIDEINAADVNAVLIAGDLMQSANPEAAADFKVKVARLKAKCWFVAGNHDVGDKVMPTRPATVTDTRVAQYEHWFGPTFYAAEIMPGLRVIGIASSLLGSGTRREAEQWDFLVRELDRPRDDTTTILLTHYAPFAERADEPDGYFNIATSQRARLHELLQRRGASLVLSGHLHRPIDYDWDGIRVIGAPAVSFGLPEGKQPEGWRLVSRHADGRITSELRYIEPPTTRPSSSPATRPATAPNELLWPLDQSPGAATPACSP